MTQLTNAINRTLELTDLHPSDDVNATLSRLVYSIINTKDSEFSYVPLSVRHEIQRISGSAESYLETYWAKRILTSSSPARMLKQFPYYDNYTQLVRHETTLIEDTGLSLERVDRCLIIGSGPLPLTAIHLRTYLREGIMIDHVDSEKDAISYCARIGVVEGCAAEKHYIASGQDVVLGDTYDLVLIAALAGAMLEEKQAIVNNILPYVTDGGRILVRSARGVRGLLYPAFAPSSLSGVRLLKEHHPQDETINSVFIYEKERV